MWRRFVAVVAGALTIAVVTFAVESIGMALFPPPAGLDVTDPAQIAAFMDTIPLGAKVMVVVAWVLAGLAGGFVAGFTAELPTLRPAITVGVIDVALVAVNLVSIPHPLWMKVTGLLLPIPAAALGGVLARRFASYDPPSAMPPG